MLNVWFTLYTLEWVVCFQKWISYSNHSPHQQSKKSLWIFAAIVLASTWKLWIQGVACQICDYQIDWKKILMYLWVSKFFCPNLGSFGHNLGFWPKIPHHHFSLKHLQNWGLKYEKICKMRRHHRWIQPQFFHFFPNSHALLRNFLILTFLNSTVNYWFGVV